MQGLPAHLTPATAAGRAGLAALLADPAHALVALDYDGTLAPIVDDPATARPHPDAPAALARLAARAGSVAVISGRPAAGVVELGGLDGVAALERVVVFGVYGAQRWAAGRLEAAPGDQGLDAARAELPAVLAGAPAGVTVEDKGHALAVHTRTAPQPAGALAALGPVLHDLAARHGLDLQPGRYVLELRAPGHDKGRTLRAYATETGARAVLYAGDDLGDLPAFEALGDLRASGVAGLAVAVSSPQAALERAGASAGRDPLAERADLVVADPAALVALLTALADLAR